MNTNFAVVINIIVMLGLVYLLHVMQKKHISFTKRVITALGVGLVFGLVLQAVYGRISTIVTLSNTWFDVMGSGYVRLLQMIVMPLIIVSITSAITNLKDTKSLRKMGGLIIAVLLITTAIAASVGAATSLGFNLSAVGIEAGKGETDRGKYMETKLTEFQAKPITQQLTEVIPTNPIYSATGQGSTATLSIVIFSALIGLAVLGIRKKNPQSAEFFINMVNSVHDVVLRLVTMIIRLTPYGVLALITKVASSSDYDQILKLLKFVAVSYIAILIMFVIHMIILAFYGLNPITYIKKVLPVLTFAFTSRTSAGTMPLTIETQIKKLGVPESIANLAASFGVSIGQNGCAGIYPAMLAVMIAPTVGINPLDPGFLIKLILVVTIGSFGVTGVGGGATYAALIVLSTMGLPVALAGLLISIEPLIDMARTALNVSDALVAGLVSSKYMKELDTSIYNSKEIEIAA